MFKVKITDHADKAEVYLYGTIGQGWWGEGNSAKEFSERLGELSPKPLDVRIDSCGGDVYEAFAIASIIQRYEGETTAYVDGIAASAASYIAVVCDRVAMSEFAFFMIHNSWCYACGNAKELASVIARLDQIDASIREIIANRSGMSREQVAAYMDGETWFSAEEALENGLCQEVIETEERMAACIPRELAAMYLHVPCGVAVEAPRARPLESRTESACAGGGATSHAVSNIDGSSKEAEGAASDGKTYRLLNGRLYERNGNGNEL